MSKSFTPHYFLLSKGPENANSSSVGFTFIELLVVISIILVLTALILPNYWGGKQYFALQRSAHKLAQDLRKTEQMAISAKEFQGEAASSGYGIILDKNWSNTAYRIYADRDGDGSFSNGDKIVGKSLNLEKEVFIKKISIDFDSSSQSEASTSINFKPPHPEVKITSGGKDGKKVTTTLALKTDSSQTKKVIVNKAGLIYVE